MTRHFGRRLFAGLMCALCVPRPSPALDRNTAADNARDFANYGPYAVSSANVYPNVSCYTSSDREKVPATSFQFGEAYSYGNWHQTGSFADYLADGRGAGNSKSLFRSGSSCVYNHITGIDCSGLVSRSWGRANRLTTASIAAASNPVAYTAMQAADVLNKEGSHVVEFLRFYGPASDLVGEFVQAAGNVTPGVGYSIFSIEDFSVYIDEGYTSYANKDLADDPDASLLWIGSDPNHAVAWQTGWERDCRGYKLYSARPDGSVVPLTDLIAPLGRSGAGARYEVRLNGPVAPGETVRLQEIDQDGQTRWLGRTAPPDGIPALNAASSLSEGQWQPPAVSPGCTLMSDPAKTNLSWIAICDPAWVSALTPLVNYRNSHGLRAGVWTYDDLAACGGLTKENIRSKILEAVQTWTLKPRYVVLIGDASYLGGAEDALPLWSQPNAELGGMYWDNKIWSDRPYADPDGDGSVDVYVGRIPASSAGEVNNMVTHIILREAEGDPTYGSRCLSLVEDSGNQGNDPAWVRALADSMSDALPPAWTTTSLIQSELGGSYFDWERAATQAWSTAPGLVMCFGNASGWWDLNSFMNTCNGWSYNRLTANAKFPFFFSGSCGVGGFDRENSTCFSPPVIEHLLVMGQNRGASGALAPTRVVHPYTAMKLGRHFLRRVFGGSASLGQAAYRAMDDLVAETPGSADHVWEYVFFGDPAMRSFGPAPTGVAESTPPGFHELRVNRIAPNPTTGATVVSIELSVRSPVHLRVFDISGRLVHEVELPGLAAGIHDVQWDGTADGGSRVVSGLYVLRVGTPHHEEQRKVVVLR